MSYSIIPTPTSQKDVKSSDMEKGKSGNFRAIYNLLAPDKTIYAKGKVLPEGLSEPVPIRWLDYFVPVLLVAISATLRVWPLHGLELRLAYLTFYPSVMISALYGGLPAGILATVLSAMTVLFWHSGGQSFISDYGDWLGMGVFFVNCTMISFICRAMLRARAQLDAAYAKMLQTQKLESLGILAGGIAHDFNNLLMSIMGNTEIALISLPPDSKAGKCLTNVQGAAGRAAVLTKQMLAYSGKGMFVVESINLSELIRGIMELLKASISKKIELKYNLAADLPNIEADAAQMRQLIVSLVVNASEAIEDDTGEISVVTGHMKCRREYLNDAAVGSELPEGTYVYIEVSDNGRGMDETTKAKIFDPFFTTKFTGRGLGLAAVSGIVRGHKGAIKVSSTPGDGSRFRVLFPMSGKYNERPKEEKVSMEWKGRGTVLLIDDEEIVRDVTKSMLEKLAFSVITAKDGPEGIELYRRHSGEIKAVLLDLTMPKMNGNEVLRELKKIRDNVPIILVSGYNVEEMSDQSIGDGFAGFLGKPYTLDRLADKLKEVLG